MGTLATPEETAQILLQLPVTNFMPPQGVEFRYHSGQNLPAIGVTVNVIQFTVPKGMNGIINRLANIVDGAGYQDFSGSTLWQLFTDLASGTLAANFGSFNPATGQINGSLSASLGSIASPAKLNGIRIRENQLVTLQFTNVALGVAGQIVGGVLGGYFYPASLEPPMGF